MSITVKSEDARRLLQWFSKYGGLLDLAVNGGDVVASSDVAGIGTITERRTSAIFSDLSELQLDEKEEEEDKSAMVVRYIPYTYSEWTRYVGCSLRLRSNPDVVVTVFSAINPVTGPEVYIGKSIKSGEWVKHDSKSVLHSYTHMDGSVCGTVNGNHGFIGISPIAVSLPCSREVVPYTPEEWLNLSGVGVRYKDESDGVLASSHVSGVIVRGMPDNPKVSICVKGCEYSQKEMLEKFTHIDGDPLGNPYKIIRVSARYGGVDI